MDVNNIQLFIRFHNESIFSAAYLFNSGHGTGYGFEIINTAFRKPKNSKVVLDYLMYGKSGAMLGYGSWVAFIPEIKFGSYT